MQFQFGRLNGQWRDTKVCAGQSRVDSEIPSWCAFTAVAPAVRFSVFEILATPIFFLARDLNSRKSEAVHERRVGFFLLAGIIGSLVEGARLLPQPSRLAMAEGRAAAGQERFDFPHTRTWNAARERKRWRRHNRQGVTI
jgi:hypothetical protein